jgi:hypothetical protein
MMVPIESFGPQVATLRVMTCATVSFAHDVALGQYSGNAVSRAENDNRTDAILRKQPRCFREIGVRLNGDNFAAFGGQNCFQDHGQPPCPGLRRDRESRANDNDPAGGPVPSRTALSTA